MSYGSKLGQSVPEMIESAKQKRGNHKSMSYKGASDTAEFKENRLKKLIHCSMEQLAKTISRAPVNLEDTEDVTERLLAYYRVCEEEGVYPTMVGLALALGYTERSLQRWIQKRSDHPTGKLLELFNDNSSMIIANSNLRGDTPAAAGIFHLKNKHGWKDQTDIAVAPVQEDKPKLDAEEIRARYLLPDSKPLGGVQYIAELEDGKEVIEYEE